MCGTVLIYGVSAFFALILVAAGVGVAQAEFELKVPVAAEDEGIAVCDSGTDEPALETVVLQLSEVAAEEFEVSVDVADVVYTAMSMSGKEMSGKAVAEPPSGLRLDVEVLADDAAAAVPRTVIPCYIITPFGIAPPELDSEVG